MGVIRHPEQRVAMIIDTQNLYHSAKNLYKSKVDFGAVVDAAVQDRKLIRAVSYVVNTEGGEESAFFDALEKVGIEIKTKDLQIFYGGAKKADWDVGMAVDAIKLSKKVDAIILATGDGDFIPLVEYIKSQGCQMEVITFGRSASSGLKSVVDDFIDMDDDPKHFLIGYRPTKKSVGRKTTGRASGKQGTKTKASTKSQPNTVVGTDTDYLA
ncbi:NYN domain-containing protein [Candidatus Nomurabacteria bacterium]|nr:NYN domain-containing protein [Candidatus Nomurabacteria bacterium]